MSLVLFIATVSTDVRPTRVLVSILRFSYLVIVLILTQLRHACPQPIKTANTTLLLA